MRIATISALGLILASGSAWAQSDYNERSRGDSYGYQDQSDRSSGDSYRHHSERGGDRDHDRDHSSSGKNMQARGASLYLKSGDKEFRVDCGDEDSTRECVDAALVMFREMHNAHGASPSSSTSTHGSTGPTTPGAGPGASSGSATGR